MAPTSTTSCLHLPLLFLLLLAPPASAGPDTPATYSLSSGVDVLAPGTMESIEITATRSSSCTTSLAATPCVDSNPKVCVGGTEAADPYTLDGDGTKCVGGGGVFTAGDRPWTGASIEMFALARTCPANKAAWTAKYESQTATDAVRDMMPHSFA